MMAWMAGGAWWCSGRGEPASEPLHPLSTKKQNVAFRSSFSWSGVTPPSLAEERRGDGMDGGRCLVVQRQRGSRHLANAGDILAVLQVRGGGRSYLREHIV